VKCDKTVDVNEVAFALRNMIGQQTTNGFARLDVVSEWFFFTLTIPLNHWNSNTSVSSKTTFSIIFRYFSQD